MANTLAGDVSVIDTQTNLVIATIGGDDWLRPSAMAFTPDGSRAFVVDNVNVFVVDTATRQAIPGGAPADTGPFAIAVDSLPEPCLGDCDANGVVMVNELIAGVNLILDRDQSCAAFHARCSATATVRELVAAVDNSLNGCPGASAVR